VSGERKESPTTNLFVQDPDFGPCVATVLLEERTPTIPEVSSVKASLSPLSINKRNESQLFSGPRDELTSKILLKLHLCSFLKHPTTVPVLCLPSPHITKHG